MWPASESESESLSVDASASASENHHRPAGCKKPPLRLFLPELSNGPGHWEGGHLMAFDSRQAHHMPLDSPSSYYINYLTKAMQLEDPRGRSYRQLQNERCSTESIALQVRSFVPAVLALIDYPLHLHCGALALCSRWSVSRRHRTTARRTTSIRATI